MRPLTLAATRLSWTPRRIASTSPTSAPSPPTTPSPLPDLRLPCSPGRAVLPRNVYHPPREGYPQDALFAGNKVELSPFSKVRFRPEGSLRLLSLKRKPPVSPHSRCGAGFAGAPPFAF